MEGGFGSGTDLDLNPRGRPHPPQTSAFGAGVVSLLGRLEDSPGVACAQRSAPGSSPLPGKSHFTMAVIMVPMKPGPQGCSGQDPGSSSPALKLPMPLRMRRPSKNPKPPLLSCTGTPSGEGWGD